MDENTTHRMVHDFSADISPEGGESLPMVCSACGASQDEAEKTPCPVQGL